MEGVEATRCRHACPALRDPTIRQPVDPLALLAHHKHTILMKTAFHYLFAQNVNLANSKKLFSV
jgi:hypothetical protein